MPRGGARKGAGRPPGSTTKRTREIANRAAESGMLPHELLLAICRGETIGGVTPTFEQRLEAARHAAPFFAPRLAAVDMATTGTLTIHEVSDEPMSADDWAARYTTEH